MSDQEIVAEVKGRLNEEGRNWGLNFEVSQTVQPDGGWLQVFIKSNAERKNRSAESQIISDVESDVSEAAGRELLLVTVEQVESPI